MQNRPVIGSLNFKIMHTKKREEQDFGFVCNLQIYVQDIFCAIILLSNLRCVIDNPDFSKPVFK